MALKLIAQGLATLEAAYLERKGEYDLMRSNAKWSGAISHAGLLVELMLKRAICKHMGVSRLPKIFQTHDLELLLYVSGQQSSFDANPALKRNFEIINGRWSIDLRYQGPRSQNESDIIDEALFDKTNGVITELEKHV